MFYHSKRNLSILKQLKHKYFYSYANTHSEHNAYGKQITELREESRSIIKKCVNANDDDAVIFTGSGIIKQ